MKRNQGKPSQHGRSIRFQAALGALGLLLTTGMPGPAFANSCGALRASLPAAADCASIGEELEGSIRIFNPHTRQNEKISHVNQDYFCALSFHAGLDRVRGDPSGQAGFLCPSNGTPPSRESQCWKAFADIKKVMGESTSQAGTLKQLMHQSCQLAQEARSCLSSCSDSNLPQVQSCLAGVLSRIGKAKQAEADKAAALNALLESIRSDRQQKTRYLQAATNLLASAPITATELGERSLTRSGQTICASAFGCGNMACAVTVLGISVTGTAPAAVASGNLQNDPDLARVMIHSRLLEENQQIDRATTDLSSRTALFETRAKSDAASWSELASRISTRNVRDMGPVQPDRNRPDSDRYDSRMPYQTAAAAAPLAAQAGQGAGAGSGGASRAAPMGGAMGDGGNKGATSATPKSGKGIAASEAEKAFQKFVDGAKEKEKKASDEKAELARLFADTLSPARGTNPAGLTGGGVTKLPSARRPGATAGAGFGGAPGSGGFRTALAQGKSGGAGATLGGSSGAAPGESGTSASQLGGGGSEGGSGSSGGGYGGGGGSSGGGASGYEKKAAAEKDKKTAEKSAEAGPEGAVPASSPATEPKSASFEYLDALFDKVAKDKSGGQYKGSTDPARLALKAAPKSEEEKQIEESQQVLDQILPVAVAVETKKTDAPGRGPASVAASGEQGYGFLLEEESLFTRIHSSLTKAKQSGRLGFELQANLE